MPQPARARSAPGPLYNPAVDNRGHLNGPVAFVTVASCVAGGFVLHAAGFAILPQVVILVAAGAFAQGAVMFLQSKDKK